MSGINLLFRRSRSRPCTAITGFTMINIWWAYVMEKKKQYYHVYYDWLALSTPPSKK